MLEFFKINDPIRIIGALLILLAIRLPLILGGIDITLPEIGWMTLGEALANGKKMYLDVWDNTGPLAAGIYWILFNIGGKSQWLMQLLSILLVMHQAYIFNRTLLRNNIYNQKNYIPAVLYVIFMCMSFDFLTLPPVLIALSFLLQVLRSVIRLDNRSLDQEVFSIGAWTGVATLIYIPSIFFLAMAILSLASFRISSIRKLFLAIYGFVLVIVFYMSYPFFNDGLQEFLNQYVYSYFSLPTVKYITLPEIIRLCIAPGIFLTLAIFRTFTDRNFVNFQVSCQQIMLIWVATAAAAVFFSVDLAPYQLILFVPALSFFGTHFLLIQRRKLFAELTFLVSSGAIVALMYLSYHRSIPSDSFVDYKNYIATEDQIGKAIKGKKLLVLGEDISYYKNNTLATKYYNWDLSQKHLSKLNNYAIISAVYKEFEKDIPEVIIDQHGLAEQLFIHAPILAEKYVKDPNLNGVYKLKN
ncbi:hypothetical protein V6R21_29725 [Limibacter armeniacum]|uniref:hypothetical protein n=1 Tax=Limibacter armeniacum TaxID=466084 RepID=UPI002FE5F63D